MKKLCFTLVLLFVATLTTGGCARVVAQFRSGHGPIPVLFECYRIRTDSGMPRLDIRFSTSHLMMASTR